jgi:penicillin-binding protein 1A
VAVWILVAVVAGLASFTGGLLSAPVDFTAPAPPKSALLLDSSGRVFASIRSPEQRQEIPAADIPQVMRDAIVAAEDRTFFSNSGVDPFAIGRAAWRDITGSRIQGGSTITQQYVKQVYTNSQRNLLRKVREAALAVRLEHKLSKDEILTRYLNTVYFGNGTYGIQAAAKYYFGVPVKSLDLDARTGKRSPSLALGRAAMLAGLVPAPSVWNPVRSLTDARKHELEVLNRMVQDGKITAQQASDGYGRQPPTIVKQTQPEVPTIAPEFRDLVRTRLADTYTPDELFKSGLHVTTTLDLELQRAAVTAVASVLPGKNNPEAAVVAIDPRNGDIKAMTTRVNRNGKYAYETGGFNLATSAPRSSGSTIKPFTLAVALQKGRSVNDQVCAGSTARVPNPGGTPNPYFIHNAEPAGGCYSLASALQHSVNTIYGPLALKIGLKTVLEQAVAAGFGPADRVLRPLVPAKSIGGGLEVTPLSEAVAYSTLANHGVKQIARTILTVRAGGGTSPESGEVVYRAPRATGQRAMPAAIADQVVDVLKGVVEKGTATRARQNFTVFGKTGTTNDETDAWFVGCTDKLCIATWMGYDRPYKTNGTANSMVNIEGVSRVYGGTLPAEIFSQTWKKYEQYQQARLHPEQSAKPSPTSRPQRSSSPRPRKTPVASPRPTKTVTAPPSPTQQPSPTPRPTCTTLLCGGTGAPQQTAPP